MKKAFSLFVSTALVLAVLAVSPRAGDRPASALIRTRLGRNLTYSELVRGGVDVLALYRDGRVDCAVTDEQLDWLRSKGVIVAVLERAEHAAPTQLDENLGLYHTYDEMNVVLDALVSTYPTLARLDTLGTSIEGRLIRAIKISDNAGTDEDEPEVLIMGCHHAREIMSVDVPLRLAQYLLDNYGTSSEITGLVEGREIWIAPMINPDGHVYVQNNHSDPWWQWWRKNRRDNGDGSFGVDPNRNYSYMWGYDDIGSSPSPSSEVYRGTAPFSEPETQAVRDFCAGRSFTLALSYHTYGELILFPWGYAPIYTDDHELFITLADSLRRGNDYTPGCTAMDVLYPTNGDTGDWAYGEAVQKNSFPCFTIEMNTYEDGGFGPPDDLILPTFNKVLGLNLTLLRRADNPYSVLGPYAPVLEDIVMLNPPNYELTWNGPSPSDPNQAVSWELVEFKNLSGVVDSCEAGDTLWTTDGFTLSPSRSYAGIYSFYSGSGDNLSHYLSMDAIYPFNLGDTLSCYLWYDIEQDWDYAYLEASIDQGLTWQTVPGDRTTTSDPNGNNRGNGITGLSGGWISAEFYLDQLGIIWPDLIILLRFSYITDDYVTNEGFYVDLIYPVSSYEKRTVLAEAHPDTVYHRWPEETGEFAYLVRAIDDEGHKSLGATPSSIR
ncbi:MAG: immune inhibitor A [bacterium]|nr:MAG: immune inhibitor A [bacterium]